MVPLDACQELADILYLCAEGCGPLRIDGIVAQEMAILFQVGAAASRVDDDGIAVIWLEDIDIVPCQRAALFALASVDMQRAATLLLHWRDDFTTVRGQHTNGGLVDVTEHLVHDAAADEADAVAFAAHGGRHFWQGWEEEFAAHIGHQFFWHFELALERRGQRVDQIEQAQFVNERLQARALVNLEAGEDERGNKARREHNIKKETAQ